VRDSMKYPVARRRLIGASLLLAATALTALALPREGASASVTTKPNVLLILVDDQAMNTFKPAYMPEVYRWIVKPGTKFTSGLAAPPLCCPDRAGILTGQYPHNNDVFSNDPGYASLNGKHDTLPVWLRRAGYYTGFDGKFLNDLSVYQGTKPAPGFNYWFGFLEPPGYYGYSMSDNGTQTNFGSKRVNYSTDVLTRRANQFLQGAPTGKPWFLWLAYNAPHDTKPTLGSCGHSSPIPATEDDYNIYGRHPLPTPPSFNERDVSDKPSFIASLHHISPAARRHIVTRWKCTLATMHEVDTDVGQLMLKLEESGALDNTIVFYLSDNGYFFGEHRLTRGKSSPYEEALQVPYAVRVPPAYQGTTAPPHASSEVVSNQDIAPTILDYAGGAQSCAGPNVCRVEDGRSLRPLLSGSGNWPADRGVLAEINAGGPGTQYAAIRTSRYVYVEYNDGEKELYDLRHDPFEKTNKAGHPAYALVEADLAQRLLKLRTCSGLHGHQACQ
jgi:N-acetylglucosamine-6-sulfatase